MCSRNKNIIFTTEIIPEENSNLKLFIKGSAQGELQFNIPKIRYPNLNRILNTENSSGFSIRKVDIIRILKYNKTDVDKSAAENLIQFSVQNNRLHIDFIHDHTDGIRIVYQQNIVVQNLE